MRTFLRRLPLLFLFLAACAPPILQPLAAGSSALYVLDLQKPALLELADDFGSIGQEIPLSLPPACVLAGLYPSPGGVWLAAEITCPNGPLVLLIDPLTGSVSPLFSSSNMDSHFLAWSADGERVYLRVNALADPRIIAVEAASLRARDIPIDAYTYHLAARPDGQAILFAFSHGLGLGSEMWLAAPGGGQRNKFYTDAESILAFATWSPDGKSIAFIKVPDSQVPYTLGELWVMDAEGGNAHKLSDADAGHGYAAAWSPDGTRLAFVQRSNPDDSRADRSLEALVSNIAVVEAASGEVTQITDFRRGRAETPVWSPDGNTLSFNYVLDGRMEVQVANLTGGNPLSLQTTGPVCCPVWLRK